MKSRSVLGTPLEIAFRGIGAHLRSSRRVTRFLFGVDPLPGTRRTHWDLALLALRGPLLHEVGPSDRVLEVGTGDLGLLSLFVAHRRPEASVTAVDINASFAANAAKNARHNGLVLDVRVSDLFAAVTGPYDVVVSVLPYVPTAWGRRHTRFSTRPEPECVWDGGHDGLDVVRRFLAGVPGVLAPAGRVLMVTSDFFHDPAEVEAELAAFRVLRAWRGPINPTRLWVLEPRSRDAGRANVDPLDDRR